MGAVSDKQFAAIKQYLADGGAAILSLPFGTKDENGFPRKTPLSDELLKAGYSNLTVIEKVDGATVKELIQKGTIRPTIEQKSGETGWALRMRKNDGRFFLHILNRDLEPIAHEALTGAFGNGRILKDFKKTNQGGEVSYLIHADIPENLELASPECGSIKKPVKAEKTSDGTILSFDLSDFTLYSVVQQS